MSRKELVRESADVVVIGSGAGGAVAARELSRAGLRVIVLEEGPEVRPAEYGALSPSRALRKLIREAGLGFAFGLGDTPMMSVLAGRCVGGSSVLTGGVCFRIPHDVLHEWTTERGLGELTPEKLAPLFEEVENDIRVSEVPVAMRSRSTELFVEGARALGVTMKSLRRNTSGCKGAARCNFGCPNGAKMSVDIAVLPEARARGVDVIASALVSRIDVANGAARGVSGRLLADAPIGKAGARFEIGARAVVIACGALHTPVLLAKSGLGGRHVGRHLTLHPAFRIGALFDERVEGWDGAMQSVYSDHFAAEGLTLVGVWSTPNILAAAFPGVGREHRRIVRALPHLAFFGAMVHDDGAGRVRRGLGREPFVTYRMTERDRARMWRGIGILGEMAFAAGAREVMLPIFGASPIRSRRELRTLLASPPSARKVESMSFHPLGTARMSARAEDGVVDPNGRLWGAPNVYVADGSVLPSSIGVNSQVPVMAMAMRIARGIAGDFGRIARRAA